MDKKMFLVRMVCGVCVCVFVSEHLSVTTCGLDDIQSASAFILSLHCVCVRACACVHRVNGQPVSCAAFSVSTCELNRRGNQREVFFFLFIGHFMFSLMNVFIGYVIRSSSGWLVKLFNFINLR